MCKNNYDKNPSPYLEGLYTEVHHQPHAQDFPDRDAAFQGVRNALEGISDADRDHRHDPEGQGGSRKAAPSTNFHGQETGDEECFVADL